MYRPLHNDRGINETRITDLGKEKVLRDYVTEDTVFKQYDMTNVDKFAYPWRKYYYNVSLKNVQANFYINSGIVSGTFESVYFSCDNSKYGDTFWDSCTFKNCKFINCQFGKLDIRWCKFDNCQFIGCTGTIRYIRASTFKKNCSFKDSDIKIEQVDEYFFLNSKRQKNGYMQLCEK